MDKLNVDEKELNELFDSFELDGTETLEGGSEGNGESFVRVEKYLQIEGYSNQDSDVIISKDKRIGNFNNQVTIQGESDSQYIVFEMERYYDGIDILDKTIQIHYERQDGYGDNNQVINVEASKDKIRFGWVVPASATQVSGILKVMPFAIGTSPVSENNFYVIKEMYSEYTVYKGLNITEGITKPTDQWYEKFVLQMESYVKQVSDDVKLIGDSVEDVKRYRDETEELAERVEGVGETIDEFEEYSEQVKQDVGEFKQEAELSKLASSNSALMSKSYAEGGTGLREDEANKNAKYFMEQAQRLVEAVSSGALIPAGTITFEEIPEESITGYMYNISNNFITDERFVEGTGKRYNSGVNIYWTVDGKLDVLSGVPPTKEDIGLGNVPNVSTNNQTPTFERAEERENILSGETLSVLFGKLSKVIFDLSNVAFSGKYEDLSNKPELFSEETPIEFTEPEQRLNLESGDAISTLFGKQKEWNESMADVAFSGSYDDLDDKPTNIESANYLKGEELPLAGKTIDYLRTVLDNIASYANSSRTAIATLRVNGNNLINLWNGNSSSNIVAGGSATFTLIATYYNNNFQVWLYSAYSSMGDENYIITKYAGEWGRAERIALEKNIPTTPAEIGAASIGELTGRWKAKGLSSPGWYRVAKDEVLGNGRSSSCSIYIKRNFTNNDGETHKVELINRYNTSVFKSVYDSSGSLLVKKIRNVHANNHDKRYIDIYYDGVKSNSVSVILEGIINWRMVDFEPVQETTAGETVMAEMEFEANSWLGGVSDIETYNVPKPEVNNIFTGISSWGCSFSKYGKVVNAFVDFNGTMEASDEYETLFVVPETYRPSKSVLHNYISGNGTPMTLYISKNTGVFQLLNNGNKIVNTFPCRQNVTYIVD